MIYTIYSCFGFLLLALSYRIILQKSYISDMENNVAELKSIILKQEELLNGTERSEIEEYDKQLEYQIYAAAGKYSLLKMTSYAPVKEKPREYLNVTDFDMEVLKQIKPYFMGKCSKFYFDVSYMDRYKVNVATRLHWSGRWNTENERINISNELKDRYFVKDFKVSAIDNDFYSPYGASLGDISEEKRRVIEHHLSRNMTPVKYGYLDFIDFKNEEGI